MKHLKILLICLLAAISVTSRGQMARLYTAENGLSNSKINDIYQDSKGFIWICTEDGLVQLAGTDFTTWHYERDKENSLASNLVLCAFEDSFHNFWVGTSKGLQMFNEKEKTFTLFDLKDNNVPSSMVHISCIEEHNGELWVASSEHGIYTIDIKTLAVKNDKQGLINRLLPSLFVNKVFLDSRGRAWIASETGGLSMMDADKLGKIETFGENPMVSCFAEDIPTGNILIGTVDSGILIYNQADGSLSRAAATKDCNVQALLFNKTFPRAGERAFLVGTENQGLKIYDPQRDILGDMPVGNLNSSNWKIHCLMEDKQQNIWLGAYQNGVAVIPRSMYGFTSIGSGDGCVTSILKDSRDGSLWTGTDGSGLIHYGGLSRKTVLNSSNSALSNNSIMALVQDKRGTIWVATYQNGLYTANGSLRPFANQGEMKSEKTVALAYNPTSDHLYVGTFGAGMYIVDASSGEISGNVPDNKWINSLYVDHTGMVWIGTFNGVFCYNPGQGKLITYDLGGTAPQERVYSFYEGKDGTMWIGTGEGLISFQRTSGEKRLYSEEDGLASNVVCGVLEGDGGYIWASTTNGLSRLNPNTGKITNYYAFDGLQGNEFAYRSALKADDGMLMFGGTGGLTVFYPQMSDQKLHAVPPVLFTKLQVTNEQQEIPENGVRIPYNSKIFAISFGVLEYTNPQKIEYAYRVENFDNNWHYTRSDARTATYTNLPPGKYKFTVKAYFEGNEQDFSQNSLSIRILPPWYRSWWAYILYALLLASGLYLLWTAYRRHQRHKQHEHESEIQQMKIDMFTNLSHEIRTPLTLVQAPLKKLRENETDPQQKELYNLMYRNCLRINRMVNQLMDMQKIDSGSMDFHFRETDIVFFVKDIMKSFSNMAATERVSLNLSSENEVQNVWIDQGNFDKVIYNILSNAFKHTPEGGSINVSISDEIKNRNKLADNIAKYIRIDIFNSGSKISEDSPERVFERFHQSNVMDAKVGTGVGLNLAKMLAEKHHGDIEVQNTGDGVTFSVYLPVGNDHLSEEEMSTTSHHKDLYSKTVFSEALVDNHEDQTYAPEEGQADKVIKSKKSIVIVDDDKELCSYLRMELRDTYNIHTCSDGKEAWAYISTAVPDAVLTDLVMENMNGLELCEKIKHNPGTNHIPVIMITSHTGELTAQKSAESGSDLFLTKPVNIDLLKSSISNLISTRETIKNKYTTEINYDYDEIQMTSSGGKIIDNVIEVIKKNIDNPDFSVEDLSREVGMSRVHLNRKLKESINISPSHLIKSMRLKQAGYLLINNDVNISEVAYRVGFSTPSYFSSSFSDYFGLTPKEFVAKYQGCTDEEVLKKLFK